MLSMLFILGTLPESSIILFFVSILPRRNHCLKLVGLYNTLYSYTTYWRIMLIRCYWLLNSIQMGISTFATIVIKIHEILNS